MKLNSGEIRHQVRFSGFREIKLGEDCIVHFILQRVCSCDWELFSFTDSLQIKRSITSVQQEKVSEGEYDLIQIFFLTSRLLVAVATQRCIVYLKERWLTFLCMTFLCHVFNPLVLRHFKIRIYDPIICLCFLKKRGVSDEHPYSSNRL